MVVLLSAQESIRQRNELATTINFVCVAMPVIANQKKPDHLYCPPDALHPASLHHGLPYHPAQLNGNTLRRTLEEFRAHHQACAVRRRNGLEYELRVEAQRTEWLTRKFMDGVRQQQQQQSQSGSGTTASTTTSGGAQGKTEPRSSGEGATGTGAAANATSSSSNSGGTASSATEVSSTDDGDITVVTWLIHVSSTV